MKTRTLKKLKPIRIIGTIALVSAIVLAGVLGFNIYKDTEAFDADKLLSSGASVMYDSNGEVMYTYGSDENGTRENITYDDLPQVLVDAVIAAEDSRFFEHNGFDLPRIAKAAISNLATGGRQGGSTITQQLIKKTYFPNAERTYTRKLSEVFLAIQADKALSKEEILTLYSCIVTIPACPWCRCRCLIQIIQLVCHRSFALITVTPCLNRCTTALTLQSDR